MSGLPETGIRPAAPRPSDAAPRYGLWIAAVLAATQTVGYGVLYYAYAVFLAPTAAALRTDTTVVAGALTCAVLASAAAAVPVGRWLDRHGGRALMVGGSIAATLLVLAWSRVHSVAALYLVWTGIGVAQACVLYEAAFAVIVGWFRRPANAVLAVTVVAGFASTIFLPLAGHLLARYGWRTAIVALAVIYGAVTVPGHLVVRRPPCPPADRRTAGHPAVRAAVSAALHDPGYWALTLAFVCAGAAVAAVSIHIVAYLTELGHSPSFAATAAGLLGVLSVTGRLATTVSSRRFSPITVIAVFCAVQATAAAGLPLVGRGRIGAIGCLLGLGLGFGVVTIARPAILADRYGSAGYATISGISAVPLTVAKGAAPLAAAAVRDATGRYTAVAFAVAGLCVVAAAGLVVAGRVGRPGLPAEPTTGSKTPTG